MWCGPRSLESGAGFPPVSISNRAKGGSPSLRDRSPLAALAEMFVFGIDRLSLWIYMTFVTRPKLVRAALIIFVLVSLVTHVGMGSAHGQTSTVQSTVFNAFNTRLQDDMHTSNGPSWMDGSLRLAIGIFGTIGFLSVMYHFVAHYVNYQSMKGAGFVLIKSLLTLGFPFALLEIVSGAFPARGTPLLSAESVQGAAQDITTKITGESLAAYTPDGINSLGLTYFAALAKTAVMHFVDPAGAGAAAPITWLAYKIPFVGDKLWDFNLLIFCIFLFMSFAILILFFLLALELFLATMEVIFVLPLAAWTLGFTASPGTAHLGSGFWQAILKTVVRYITIFAVAIFASHITGQWNQNGGALKLLEGTPLTLPFRLLNLMASMALDILALYIIIRRLPGLVSSAMSGAAATAAAEVMGAAVGTTAGLAIGSRQASIHGGGPLGVRTIAGGLTGAYTGSQRGAVHGVDGVGGFMNQRASSDASDRSKESELKLHRENMYHTREINRKMPEPTEPESSGPSS